MVELVETPPPTAEEQAVWDILHTVMDPEVPALSVTDLGIIRSVTVTDDKQVYLDVTPTYTGCPATDLIAEIIKAAVISGGYKSADINLVLSPTWSTDWITDEAREKLRAYGIAPPVGKAPSGKAALLGVNPVVSCPHCGSKATEQVSEFGSTACKAMYRCTSCLEPFEYFKCI